MYKIERMDIKDYQEIISLWENTEGIGLTEKDDSKKSYKIREDLNYRDKTIKNLTLP